MITNEKQNLIIVADCDEVLTNISPLWSHLIHKHGDYFGKYFDLVENFDYKKDYSKVLMRDEFYLNNYFRKKGLELSEEEEKELFKRFFSLYDNEHFYKFCKPTRMCHALVGLCNTNYINKLYIVSRTTDNTEKNKRLFLENTFKGLKNKVEFIPVPMNGKKSDVINGIGRVDVFMDDELKNVYDVIENVKGEMDIYIPKLGYNKPTEKLKELSEKNNKNILYYDLV